MEKYLRETKMLDYSSKNIQRLIQERNWNDIEVFERLKSIYNFVRDGTLELVEKDMPVFLVKSAGVYRTLDERAEKFLKEHTDNLIVIDVMDYMIPGLKPEFAPLVAPIISTAVLNGRLSKHIESYTGHDLDMRRYYRQFEY